MKIGGNLYYSVKYSFEEKNIRRSYSDFSFSAAMALTDMEGLMWTNSWVLATRSWLQGVAATLLGISVNVVVVRVPYLTQKNLIIPPDNISHSVNKDFIKLADLLVTPTGANPKYNRPSPR